MKKLLALGLLIMPTWLPAAVPLDFAKDILPILEKSCLPCHNETKSEGDLMLETPQLMIKGGEHGPSIKPNHGTDSLLYLTSAKLKKPYMPPAENKSKATPLTSLQLELLRRWIDEGAVGKGKAREAPHWQKMPKVERVDAAAVTNDGRLMAASRGNQVALYDVVQKQRVADLPADAHKDLVNAIAFNTDGNLLATGSFGEVKLWKLALPTVEKTAKKLEAPPSLEAHSANGSLVVSAPANAPARLTAADGKTLIAELRMDRAYLDHLHNAEQTVMKREFELSYQKEEQQQAEERLKKFDEEAKKAAEDHAAFVKKKASIDKAVADARASRDALSKVREEAMAVQKKAAQAKDETVKAEADAAKAAGEVLQKAKQAREAAVTALAAADKKLKEADTKWNEAVKTLNEAMSEVGKAVDAERTAKKTAEDALGGKQHLAEVKGLVAKAQTARDAADKAATALRTTPSVVPSPFRSLIFTPDATMVISSHDDGCLRTWSANKGEALWTIRVDASPLGSLAWVDGKLHCALQSGETMVIDYTPHWQLVRTIGDSTQVNSPLTDRVNALAFSPDGKLLATGSGDPSRSGEVKLWEVTSGKLVRELVKPHKDAVLALDFSSDSKLLASGSADRAVRLWEVATGKQLRNFEAHSNHVLSVSLRNDGRMLASAGADNAVRSWSLLTGDVVKTTNDFKKEVTGVRYIEFKNLLFGTAGDPEIRLFKDSGGTTRSDATSIKSYITASAVTPDGKVQVVGSANGSLQVFDGEGKLIKAF